MNGCCGFRVTSQTKLPISVLFHLIVSYKSIIAAHRLARDEKFLYKKQSVSSKYCRVYSFRKIYVSSLMSLGVGGRETETETEGQTNM